VCVALAQPALNASHLAAAIFEAQAASRVLDGSKRSELTPIGDVHRDALEAALKYAGDFGRHGKLGQRKAVNTATPPNHPQIIGFLLILSWGTGLMPRFRAVEAAEIMHFI